MNVVEARSPPFQRLTWETTCDRVANGRGLDHTSVPSPLHSGVLGLWLRAQFRSSSCLAAECNRDSVVKSVAALCKQLPLAVIAISVL